jgi:hypothetical protein
VTQLFAAANVLETYVELKFGPASVMGCPVFVNNIAGEDVARWKPLKPFESFANEL